MLNEILKTSDYGLNLFSPEEIQALEKSVFIKETAKKQGHYVQCLKRRKDIQLKPEEIVRQLFLRRLTDTYQYPEHRIDQYTLIMFYVSDFQLHFFQMFILYT